MSKTPSQLHLPGHKIAYSATGAQSSYWVARCACGWRSQGWHDRKRKAVLEAAAHLQRERRARD